MPPHAANVHILFKAFSATGCWSKLTTLHVQHALNSAWIASYTCCTCLHTFKKYPETITLLGGTYPGQIRECLPRGLPSKFPREPHVVKKKKKNIQAKKVYWKYLSQKFESVESFCLREIRCRNSKTISQLNSRRLRCYGLLLEQISKFLFGIAIEKKTVTRKLSQKYQQKFSLEAIDFLGKVGFTWALPLKIYLSEFVKTWPVGFRLAPGAAPLRASALYKRLGGLASWSAQADSQGTALTVGGWMDQAWGGGGAQLEG